MWKDIEEYSGKYEVNKNGDVRNKLTRKILKQQKTRFGYMTVKLFENNHGKEYRVHRLVAVAFLPNERNKPCVHHIDHDKTNNHVSNLEWCTHKENSQHDVKDGKRVINGVWLERIRESRKPMYKPVIGVSKLTGEAIYFENMRKVRSIGISPGDVSKCCKGKKKSAGGYKWSYVNRSFLEGE